MTTERDPVDGWCRGLVGGVGLGSCQVGLWGFSVWVHIKQIQTVSGFFLLIWVSWEQARSAGLHKDRSLCPRWQ